MKIVGGLLLSVFCVGSAFSCEAFVLERTSDDILQNMPQTDLISRIRVLEDAYFELKDQNTELEEAFWILKETVDENTRQDELETQQDLAEIAEMRELKNRLNQCENK